MGALAESARRRNSGNRWLLIGSVATCLLVGTSFLLLHALLGPDGWAWVWDAIITDDPAALIQHLKAKGMR